MKIFAVGIDIAEAFAVTAYPNPSVQIFTDTHDGTGEILLEMFE